MNISTTWLKYQSAHRLADIEPGKGRTAHLSHTYQHDQTRHTYRNLSHSMKHKSR